MERTHDVRITMKRSDLRAIHPGGYAFRAPEKKRESLLMAAYLAPSLFEAGVIRAHLFPVRPRTRKTWECTLALEFPLPPGGAAGDTVEREFGVIIRKGSEVAYSFDRKVSVRFKSAQVGTRTVSFAQRVELGPGTYSISAAMTAPDRERPYAAGAQVTVPPLPKGDVYLVPSVLGKRADKDVVVRGGGARVHETRSSDEVAKGDRVGDPNSFMPMLVRSVDGTEPMLALTQACAAKERQDEAVDGRIVMRAVDSEGGGVARTLPPEILLLHPKDGIECKALLDEVPVRLLTPGDYAFRASLLIEGRVGPHPQSIPFAVEQTAR